MNVTRLLCMAFALILPVARALNSNLPAIRMVSQMRAVPTMMSTQDDMRGSLVASTVGIAVQPVVWVSLYDVATTGGGLPPGPFGLVGLLEGLSYLVIVAIVGLSLFSKVTTGSGLPAGHQGRAGLAEGLSFLSVVVGLGVLAYVATQQGCVPNALPIVDYSNAAKVCG